MSLNLKNYLFSARGKEITKLDNFKAMIFELSVIFNEKSF